MKGVIYSFDSIGNRKSAGAGGGQSGGNLRYQNYTANTLNQYTSRDGRGCLNVAGSANSNATVSLWGSDGSRASAVRKDEYFWIELPVNTSTGAVFLALTNVAVLTNGSSPDIVTNTLGRAFLAGTPEAFGYDADGNLTNDGRWTYTWDAENRLIGMQALSTVPDAAKLRLDFVYDFKGRRTQKVVSLWNSTTINYQPSTTNFFVYDGWNLLAELNATNNSAIRSYVWGLDLSGSLQGAGGVGGLLAVSDQSTINSSPSSHFAAYDGNGNVTALVNANDGTLSAQYEYGPFGEVIRATGAMAKANPFRFSTKYQDDETDLLYYGYRYYNASTGRWTSRDPLNEKGGPDLYCFALNAPTFRVDKLGRVTIHLDKDSSTGKLACGAFSFLFDYYLDNVHTESGYIVQRVSVFEDWDNCYILNLWSHHSRHVEFWEYAETEPNSSAPYRAAQDTAQEPLHLFTRGSLTIYGEARWYSKSVTGDLNWPKGEYTDNATSAKPSWWDSAGADDSSGESVAWREIDDVWNCCCGKYTQTVRVDPSR
jgi:RHS repeat-associated protein